MKTCNEQSNLNTETKIGLSIIQLNQNKIPKKEWKQFQTVESKIDDWFNHLMNEGLVGILTGKISGNLEGIDIDSKNDPTNRIIEDYRALIPNELYEKLLVVITPSGGRHYCKIRLKLTTLRRFKLTTLNRLKLTSADRLKLTTCFRVIF